MRALLATAAAIISGLVILAGYFLSNPLIENLSTRLLGWAIILGAIALIIGIFSMLGTHWRKMLNHEERDGYSIFLLGAFLITLAIGLILSPGSKSFQQVVYSIQIPVETSLLALLTISLAYASMLILKRRKGYFSIIFVISILVFLLIDLIGSQLFNTTSSLGRIMDSINRLPLAGARGILLGIAIGSLTTGLRVLFGADRPYRG
jgi:membrane-anchored protein YejM (alkaline phosphatase superfamily)